MTPLPKPPAAAPQLSAEHVAQLRAARRDLRKVRRAVSTALVDGWSIGVFGAITVLLGLTDFASLALGVAMVVVAFIEIRSAARLRRLDEPALRTLGWNQIALGTALLIYAIIRLISAMHGQGEYASLIAEDPQLKEMLGGVEDLTRQIMITVYACLIGVAVFGQGGMAVYYFTRARHLRAYLAQTPSWIVEMQRAGVAV